MTEISPRLFSSDGAVRRIGEGLLDRTLPRADWTHEAHLAACLWLVRERPDIDADAELRAIISGYNVAVGGVNDDTQGFHATLTHVYLRAVRAHHREHAQSGLADSVNTLLLSVRGRRDWPLHSYSRQRLFSVEARRNVVAPDRGSIEP